MRDRKTGQQMRVAETIRATGHPRIQATHKTTLEITKDAHLTERGDCIVAVCASKGAADLSPNFRRLVRNNKTHVTMTMTAGNLTETITGRGDQRLTLSHPTDLVARKSNYVCTRTLMIGADKSASHMSPEFVSAIRNQSSRIEVEIVAEL